MSDLGGVARHVLDVGRAGIPGWRLVVLAPPGPLVDRCRELGIRVLADDVGPSAGAIASVRTVRRAIHRLQPGVVHSHLAFADIVAAIASFGEDTAIVSTEHGIANNSRAFHRSGLEARLMQGVHMLRLHRRATVIGVSASTLHQVRSRWRPGRRVTLTLIRNGIDRPTHVHPSSCEGGTAIEGLRIGAMTRLAEEKGLFELLEAYALVAHDHPDATLQIAGAGPLDESLRARIDALGLGESATLCGFREPADFLSTIEVLTQLSRWENASYTLLDAVVAGKGVVATDVGGNAELLPAHCLVPLGDVRKAASTMREQGRRPDRRPSLPEGWPTVADMTRSIADTYSSRIGAPTHRSPRHTMPITSIDFLANNADVGGGEVMLLRIASAARSLGVEVRVVGPTYASDLARQTSAADLEFHGVGGRDRRGYLLALARYGTPGEQRLLWCNGLVPALGTRGISARRVIHLHQLPAGRQRHLFRLARRAQDVVVVPSAFMADRIPGAELLENWTEDLGRIPLESSRGGPVRVGFLGRLSPRKGIDVLADAILQLERQDPGRFWLVVAGDHRLVPRHEAEVADAALARCGSISTMLGWVDPAELFGQIDLLAVPSVWDEPFGLVAAQAMAMGVPLIVSDAGALPSVVGANHPWCVHRGDAAALAASIVAVTDDPAGVRSQVDASRQRWAERFSPAAGQARLERLLRDLGVAP